MTGFIKGKVVAMMAVVATKIDDITISTLVDVGS
jgi:hypothetical protein